MKSNSGVLAVRIGNAETNCGVFVDGQLAASWRVSTAAASTPDELEQSVRAFLAARQMEAPGQAIVCSVVPAVTDAWLEAAGAVCGTRPKLVGPGLKTGLPMGYKDPAQLGTDRVVCALAAKQLVGDQPVIVADFGTTSTFSVVDSKGAFAGGVIAPGLTVSMDALASSAAQLMPLSIKAPRKVIGRSTAEAVQSGVVMGEILRADAFVDAIWDELGYQTRLVATGRYGALVAQLSRHSFAVEPDLALKGLNAIWELNQRM